MTATELVLPFVPVAAAIAIGFGVSSYMRRITPIEPVDIETVGGTERRGPTPRARTESHQTRDADAPHRHKATIGQAFGKFKGGPVRINYSLSTSLQSPVTNYQARGMPHDLLSHRIRSIAAGLILALSIMACPGMGTRAHARAAGPPHTPPALPVGRPVQAGPVAPATPPALPAESPATAYGRIGAARHGAATPRRLLPYTPASPSADGTMDRSSLLGLVATFAVVLALLFVALRVLRGVLPRPRGAGGARAGDGDIAAGRVDALGSIAGARGALGSIAGGSAKEIVLHDEPLGDENRVCLLDLGERIVLAGSSPAGLTVLAMIDDPEEIETVRARYGRGPTPRVKPWGEGEGEGGQPTFAETLREVVACGIAAGASPARDAPAAIPRMSTVSDITYLPMGATTQNADRSALDDAPQSPPSGSAGRPSRRL